MATEKKNTTRKQKVTAQPGKNAEKKMVASEKKKEVKPTGEKKGDKKEEKEEEKESVLKDIMSISGHSGLFRFISQARNGIVVENLETKKRIQAFTTMKVSSLEDIAIFTEDGEVSLEEVLRKVFEKEGGKSAIDHKSDPEKLKNYFGEVLPEYDRSRVYVSDIKKVVHWYNLLVQFNLLKFGETASEEVKGETKTQKKD